MWRVPLYATLVLLLVVASYSGMCEIDARAKLATLHPPLGDAPGHYIVELRFPPERFHLTRLQNEGRLIEVRNTSVYMMDVSRRAITGIAREYWVRSVERWAGR
jgi:hypothetical protein